MCGRLLAYLSNLSNSMTTYTRLSSVAGRFLIVAGLVASGAVAIALPSHAYAATYAYVNASGEVSAVVAPDPMTALVTAFNISVHSGVMLLINQTDSILNNSVAGV